MVLDERAVWCSTKELYGIDERAECSSKKELCGLRRKKLCGVRRKSYVVFNKRPGQSFQRCASAVIWLRQSGNDVKRQVIERCDILILIGVGGDKMAENDLGALSARHCLCSGRYTMSVG